MSAVRYVCGNDFDYLMLVLNGRDRFLEPDLSKFEKRPKQMVHTTTPFWR